jgi:hypothetical protein
VTDLFGCFVLSLLVASAPEIGAWLNARAARKTLRLLCERWPELRP